MDAASTIISIFRRNPAALPFYGGGVGFEERIAAEDTAKLQKLAVDLTSSSPRGTQKQAELLARLYVEAGMIDRVGGRTAVLATVGLMPRTWADSQIKRMRAHVGWDRDDAKTTARQLTYLAELEHKVLGKASPYAELKSLNFPEADARIKLLLKELAAAKAGVNTVDAPEAQSLAPVVDLFTRKAV